MRKYVFLTLALASVACGQPSTVRDALQPSSPILDMGDAYAFARSQTTNAPEPQELPGMHNVIQLSPTIISGSEPHGEKALQKLAAMGVKTILSVDGKVPDAATARKLGMRYVHVPIQYSGIKKDELAKIAKTFRELEPPFFVHCFHGKHRGPAAAAVGRLLIDGAPRTEALAEMVHCGVAGKYGGLYRTIGAGTMPTARETRAFDWGFDEAHPFGGIRAGMVDLTRSFDHLKALEKRGFEADPAHPDIDARNEASKVVQLYERMNADKELRAEPEDYRRWMQDSTRVTRDLLRALEAGKTDLARKHLAATKRLCIECHKAYRND